MNAGRNTTLAVALLTASNLEPDGGPLLIDTIKGYLSDGVDEAELLLGMVNVAEVLLIRLEKLAGRDPMDELRYIAERYGER